jgi:hypothetical protein
LVSMGNHMVQRTWEMNPWFSSRKDRISVKGEEVNT